MPRWFVYIFKLIIRVRARWLCQPARNTACRIP
jgi:hypothetical protein